MRQPSQRVIAQLAAIERGEQVVLRVRPVMVVAVVACILTGALFVVAAARVVEDLGSGAVSTFGFWACVVVAALLGGFGIVALIRLLVHRPTLVVERAGYAIRGTRAADAQTLMAWSEVESFALDRMPARWPMRGQRYITARATPAASAAWSAWASPTAHLVRRMEERLIGERTWMIPNSFGGRIDDTFQLLELARARYGTATSPEWRTRSSRTP